MKIHSCSPAEDPNTLLWWAANIIQWFPSTSTQNSNEGKHWSSSSGYIGMQRAQCFPFLAGSGTLPVLALQGAPVLAVLCKVVSATFAERRFGQCNLWKASWARAGSWGELMGTIFPGKTQCLLLNACCSCAELKRENSITNKKTPQNVEIVPSVFKNVSYYAQGESPGSVAECGWAAGWQLSAESRAQHSWLYLSLCGNHMWRREYVLWVKMHLQE